MTDPPDDTKRGLRVLLVVMPWASLHRPSLGVGILANIVETRGLGAVRQLYANLEWADFLLRETGGRITPAGYTEVAERYFAGAGEWIFSAALHGTDEWRNDEFTTYVRDCTDLDPAMLLDMQRLAAAFVRELTARITAEAPDIVGFSTTFMQNVPSLALARSIKRAAPGTTVVFGGGNCDGPQGAALHRNYPFLDFVVRGEGDLAFPRLLECLRDGSGADGYRRIMGLCWRDDQGHSVSNPALRTPLQMTVTRPPAYDDYFAALSAGHVRSWVEPELVLEASRGCWWGEKHQCTFCGLNGSGIQFRSKPQDEFLAELTRAVRRYRVLDVTLADNILDVAYFRAFLPGLADVDWDLRIHCEVKANMTIQQIRALRQAGVVNLQPGIESLSSPVLKLMDKGISGPRNVRLLRDCQQEEVTVEWNWLYGFPGEDDRSYAEVVEQVSAMVHLQPPSGAFRVELERFSPFFERPELGLENLGPAQVYRLAYDLPDSELRDLVYLFESRPAGITGTAEATLRQAVDEWQSAYPRSSLTCRRDERGLLIRDRRAGRPAAEHRLAAGGEAEAYAALYQDRSADSLRRHLRDVEGVLAGEGAVRAWLDRFRRLGLVFVESDRHLALAVPDGWQPAYDAGRTGEAIVSAA
jgi:ribosomal peptide maturation radical SAM protein 1